MVLVQRNEDLSIESSHVRCEAEGEADRILGKTDIVEDQVELLRRDDTADLLFHLTEEHARLLDPRSRHGAYVQAELAGIHGGKEVPSDKWQQDECSRHHACAGDQRVRRCAIKRLNRPV